MTSRINFDSASLIKDSMGLMAEYLYSLCPTAQLGVPKLEGSGKLSLLSRLNSFVNGSSGESMSSAYWGIISDSILIKLRNATSTSSSSSTLPPGTDEESRMVHIMKLFCELNVRARTSFGGTVNPVRFPPSAFFLSECLQSAFVYIRNVNNLAGKLSTVENLGSNIDSNSPDREVQVRASSSKRSAADTTIAIPPTEGEQINKQKKLTVNTTTAAPVPFQNPSSGTHSPISISEINLPRIEQIIRSFCQSKHIRANKSGEVLTKAPLQQQEQQDIFNILQQPFRRQESSQQQHILRNPTAFLQSILPAEKSLPESSNKPSDPPPPPPPPLPQKSRRKEFTRRHKKHPNRYVLTVQNPRFRPVSPEQTGSGGGAAETVVKLSYGHIDQVRKVSDSPLLPPLPDSEEGADGKKSSSAFLSISLITALKGLEVLPNNRYRVQLNTFLSNKKKLSRNTASLYEALWIFEISLLISDQPKVLDRLLRDGNYSSLAALSCFGFFRSPTEYYFELLRMLLFFIEHGLYFKNELLEAAITNFDHMKPSELIEDNVAQSIGKGAFELSSGVLLNGAEKELLSFRPMYGLQSPTLPSLVRPENADGTNSLPTDSSSSSLSQSAAAESVPDDDVGSEDDDNNDLASVSSSELVEKSTTAAIIAKEPVNVDLEQIDLSSSITFSPSPSASAGQGGMSEPLSMKATDNGSAEEILSGPPPPSVPQVSVPTDAAESNPLVNNLKQRVAGYRKGLSLKDQGLTCRNFRSTYFQALQISDSAPFYITLSANTLECFEQKMRPVVSMQKHVAR